MKLSEYRGEEALEVLADLIEPAAEIMGDKEIAKAYNAGKRVQAISLAIRNHKKAVIALLAALDRKDVRKYEVTLFTLPVKLLELLNDPEIAQLFTLQGQTGDAKSSGSVSESTEE